MKSHASVDCYTSVWRSFFSFVSGEAGTCYFNLGTVWEIDMPGAAHPENKIFPECLLPVNGKSEKLLNSSGKILYFPQVKGMFPIKSSKARRGQQYRGKKFCPCQIIHDMSSFLNAFPLAASYALKHITPTSMLTLNFRSC